MLRNYFKIALRNLLKQKVYSVINIFGLSFGMACVLLIVVYVKDELSYDKFHKHADDIYRIAWFSNNPQTRTPHPMALALVKDFPEVEAATSLSPLWGAGLTKQTFSVRNPEKDITHDEKGILSVDSTFFEVFSFELLKGNKQEVLRNVGGILLSETRARKYFGDEDPVGKELAINDDRTLLMVEGVFKDVPQNSHFHFDALISYVTMKALEGRDSPYYTWADFGHYNYIRLKPGSDPDKLESQLMQWAMKYVDVPEEEMQMAMQNGMHFKLQRLTDIHLGSRIRWELEANGNKEYVYIMSAAALLILVIACINFMNLTTARSTERAREIGIRKSLGAYKSQVSLQFLGESLLTAIFAMLVTGLLAEVCLPFFNVITHKSLRINYLQNPELILILVGGTIITGLVAALYPSLFLSSMNPVVSLKGVGRLKPKGAGFRKMLIVFQFIISMALLSGSLIIYNQLQFIHNKDLGFDNDKVIVIPLKNEDLSEKLESMRTELSKIKGITSVSATSNVPGRQFNQNSISRTDDPQSRVSASETYIDYSFFETMSIEFAAGRGFSRDFPTDSNAFVINETAAKSINLADPVGKEITWYTDNNRREPLKGTVVGVVKDFNYGSLHEPIRPLLFYLAPAYNDMLIKVQGEDFAETIAAVEQTWKKFENRFEFEYSILADDMGLLYEGEKKTANVFGGFSVIAILIACFGLFGIASLSYSQRIKEVGIRKVMGASVFRILTLLVRDFSVLIALSIIIAIPVAWAIMDNWLENFTYRIGISFFDFAISAVILVLVALVTVSYLTVKTAYSNPVDALKEE
ncbi:ABC transporter permease [Fulvivirga ulvae]|uniref:ABC transporter permease n=1 Tax=Fulvivirga ulvae TaxID=2904245 RepID=UPI001F2180D3|nr:ABC transporter permease [Fulvivirga ulvae]UII33784.1 ABC transporter permease [Fulvivirga ulvae]